MSQPTTRRNETESLAELLERTFRGGAWHGPAVLETLEGLDAASAAERPIPDAHSIWEVVHHLTAWNEVPRRRIDGERLEGLADEDDWPPVDSTSPASWERALEALDEAHRRLHERVRGLAGEDLARPVAGSDPTLRGMLLGVVQHNAYHAGQIVLLRRAAALARGR